MAKQMSDAPTMQDLSDPKSLLNQVLARLTPPKRPFDAQGDWTHTYLDMSCLRLERKQGELTISHKPDGKLRIENYRECHGGYRSFTRADLVGCNNALSAPTAWQVSTKVATASDKPADFNSGLTRKLSVAEGKVVSEIGDAQHTQPLAGLYTCKWCLLDAVGRMPRRGLTNVSFTLFDEYDELCPKQTIKHRGKAKVKTRGGPIQIDWYQHVGVGMVPGVFCVDAAGRVLVYMAGMQFLVLADADGEKTGYMK